MGTQTIRINFLFIFSAFLFFSDLVFALPIYPKISEVHGKKISDLRKNGEKLRKGDLLKKQSYITTGENSQVCVELDANTTLLLAENSTLEIPSITYEEGEVSTVTLLSGRMRIQARGESERKYTTPISSDVYSNVDFVLEYQPENLKALVYTLSGGLVFRGTESEDKARLQSHEKIYFIGLPDHGKPSFDILIGGKQVAKGKLGPVEVIKDNELSILEKEFSLKSKPLMIINKKSVIRNPDQICEKPFAKLNECVWQCPKWDKKAKKCAEDCVRRRCNANGEWADEFIIKDHRSICNIVPVVGTCDY